MTAPRPEIVSRRSRPQSAVCPLYGAFFGDQSRDSISRSALDLDRPLDAAITQQAQLTHLEVRRRDRLGGTLHEYRRAA
ncbi:hypothetical protein ABZ554_05000 [Streptomyces sp. NPDC020125]|uniref:hypothetical protein n=1 Tax=Streptomyces sp. NPDC020125 TaxID=3154593 RepID=UPI0034103255